MPKQKRNLTQKEKEEIEECKKELNEYRENIKYIEEKLEDVEEVKCKVEKVTMSFSFIKTSNSNERCDRFAEAISKLDDLKLKCSEKMERLLAKKIMIEEKIDKIEQPYRNILFYRYIRGNNWDDVAEKLGYSRDYACELHGEALYLYSKN